MTTEVTSSDTQLQLRWHSHSATFTTMLSELHGGRAFTDVVMICDGGLVRAHRAVLSLCSPYLATVLAACPEADAPLLLPEVPLQDVQYLISFIYRGQVDVPQHHISSFLNTAKDLHVLGLEEGGKMFDATSGKSDCGSSSASESEDELPETNSHLLPSNNNDGENDSDEDDEDSPAFDGLPEGVNVKVEPQEGVITEVMNGDGGRIDLNYYLQQAIQTASMPCPLCKKEFKSQSGLRDHIRLHTGERPFECEFCQMNFARASHLKRHRRMHTGEKPFECRICGKDFSRGDKLKDHLRRHEAEDKLTKIRKQIYSCDEPDNSEMELMPPVAFSQLDSQGFAPKRDTNCDSSFMPPTKRPRGRPPKSALSSQGGLYPSQLPSSVLLPQENYLPHMIGVTSIGECILRPIN